MGREMKGIPVVFCRWFAFFGPFLALFILGADAWAGGTLTVICSDGLALTSAPPEAVAVLDNGAEISFSGGLTVVFTGVSPGIHTVRVDVAEGYYEDEDPQTPGQVSNPDSLYGNPRKIQIVDNVWTSAAFGFMPMARASAVVRDAWTMERVQGMKVEFIAKNSWLAGEIYDGYPNYATYESNWYSSIDGTFPTNVLLPTITWDMRLSHTDYVTLYVSNVLSGASAGDVLDLGTHYITPIDQNANQLGDAWEDEYFPSDRKMAAGGDADGDGQDNWEEYYVGTDPTNPLSFFAADQVEGDVSNGVTITWQTADWRTYRIVGKQDLDDGSEWLHVAGTWEATNGQVQMTWNTTNLPGECVYYRLQVVPPDFNVETQQMLCGTSGGGLETLSSSLQSLSLESMTPESSSSSSPHVWTEAELLQMDDFYQETLLPLIEE